MEKRPFLMNELSQGRELANQLKGHLRDNTSATYSCSEILVEKILSSYEKALSMLNPFPILDADDFSGDSYSPHYNKKRKTTATTEKWSEQVKVCSVEGPLSDGYSWRKYGQKDILGANHPRAYYRCTHRNVQGCLATKQVQRSDEDSSVFEVSYRERHTCIQATHLSKALKEKKEQQQQPDKKCCINHAFSFKAAAAAAAASYKGAGEEGSLFPCFSFASTPIETQKLEDLFYVGCTTNFNQQASEDSDLSEMVNSTPNSPLGGWDLDLDLDFSLDHVDFDVTI